MLNIGFSPTVGKGMKKIEVHIIDLDRDLYDKIVKIKFKKWIRSEKKFNDLIELKKQLEIDLKLIKKI
jgi:riboflavin kinase/FMN adenylyltransferase